MALFHSQTRRHMLNVVVDAAVVSIRVENSVDPDQLAASEAS